MTGDNPGRLYTVNKTDGTPTLVGPIGFDHIGALDFEPSTGILWGAYGWIDGTGYLVTIDTQTGQGTFVVNTHRINGMSFDEGGVLYASENGLTSGVPTSLYQINKGTGGWTEIGSTGVDNVLGLVFDSLGGPPTAIESETWGGVKARYLRD